MWHTSMEYQRFVHSLCYWVSCDFFLGGAARLHWQNRRDMFGESTNRSDDTRDTTWAGAVMVGLIRVE